MMAKLVLRYTLSCNENLFGHKFYFQKSKGSSELLPISKMLILKQSILRTRGNVINEFWFSTFVLLWNNSLWLDFASHVTTLTNQIAYFSNCTIYAKICLRHWAPGCKETCGPDRFYTFGSSQSNLTNVEQVGCVQMSFHALSWPYALTPTY